MRDEGARPEPHPPHLHPAPLHLHPRPVTPQKVGGTRPGILAKGLALRATALAGGANHLVILVATGELYTAGVGICGQLSRISGRCCQSYHEADLRLSSPSLPFPVHRRRMRWGGVGEMMLEPALVQLPRTVKRVEKIWATAYATYALCLQKDGQHRLYGSGLNNCAQLGQLLALWH